MRKNFSWKAVGCLSLLLATVILVSGCKRETPETARIKLGELNIEYSVKSFFDYVAKNDVIAIRLFLQARMNPNAKDKWGGTALMVAAEKNALDVAKLLTEKGADVNAKDTWGNTALMVAAGENSLDVAKLLIEKGADVNVRHSYAGTALMWAEREGHSEMITLLKKHGAK